MIENGKERIIQEFVPGRQITLAHVIANPIPDLYEKLGIYDVSGALGIFTITPSEAAIIAGDAASKTGEVQIGFVDRFNGSLLIYGDVAGVKAAMKGVMQLLCDRMHFTPTDITES
ncbi:MAG: BMC domain-containing protein [Eubacteriales bacterium]|nr:BMC domain-containing protein [Eubacteriales bacterium]